MRLVLLSASALALAACGGEPVKPAEPVADTTPAASAPEHTGHGPMTGEMAAADQTDDASTAETPDGFMFHTDTSKVEKIHLPVTPDSSWVATPENPAQVKVVGSVQETMPDGAVHQVISIQPLTSGVIAKVKLERVAGAPPAPAETRTVQVMIH